MEQIYQIFLGALHSFVRSDPPPAVTREQWDALAELAEAQSCAGILCYVYRGHPDRLPAELLPGVRRRLMQEIAFYGRRLELMRQLSGHFSREGIDHILFKGFVVGSYYPVPELRTFSDVDFVIRKEDRKKADQLMLSLGYDPKDTWEPAYSYRKDTEYYEIHTALLEVDVSDKADYVNYYSRLWDYATPTPTPHVLEFTPEFHFLYLLTHIAKHINASGAGIRMYLDIAFFLRHFGDSLDWPWVAEQLQKLQLQDFANAALQAVARWFDVPVPLALSPVEEDFLADFLEFTLCAGIYGKHGRDKSLIFLKQQDRSSDSVSKGKTLLYHAFPPVKALRNRYPYLQKCPWLLPWAWVQRFFTSYREWGRFADHTKNVLTADEEAVLRLKEIYHRLGL